MIIVDFPNGLSASVESGLWNSPTEDLEKVLNAYSGEQESKGVYCHTDWSLANRMAQRFNGKMRAEPTPPGEEIDDEPTVSKLFEEFSVEKANSCHVASGPKGGQFCSTGTGGSAAVSIKVRPVKGKAWSGEVTETKIQLTKQEAGKLGEEIAIAYMKSKGMKDARALNMKVNNFPVDLVQNHGAIEVKTGLVSNRVDSQKWRATIGQPGKKETAWLKKASPEKKRAWNDKKRQDILDRKELALKALSSEFGKKVHGSTITMILNPDTRKADLYQFKGFHLNIRWNSEMAKKGYIGTVGY